MKEKLVTVVVPIYNVEKYLNVCLESIVNQTYRNLEIILVDDGSPDSCPQICDEWAQKDARIRVIHKENQGLGMARNTGIEHANGEYICFFDSDDYVDIHAIEKSYSKAEYYGVDIVIYGLKDFDDAGNILLTCIPDTPKDFFSGNEVRETFLPDLIDTSLKGSCSKALQLSAWSCLFSMDLIRKANWRFVSERLIISEDSYSLLELYKHVDSVYILNEALYYHRRNFASLSRSFRSDRFDKTKNFVIKALELVRECGYSAEVQKRVCGLFFNFSIDMMKQIVTMNDVFISKVIRIRAIITDTFFLNCLKRCRYGKSQMAKRVLKNVILMRSALITYMLIRLKTMKR